MQRNVYSALIGAIAPLAWALLGYRALRTRTRWDVLGRERFGGGKGTSGDARPVWVHAVSLGETRAAQPLIQALLAAGHQVLLTHMTPTGRTAGAELYTRALADGRLRQCWFPYDFAWVWQRFLRTHRPACLVLIEREVWPNMIATCRQQNVPVALVSARLSAGGLGRARRLGQVLLDAYGGLSLVTAQSEADANRLAAVGVVRPEVGGNLKFDVQVDTTQVAAGRAWRMRHGRPVIVLASTREGEDDAFARAWKSLNAATRANTGMNVRVGAGNRPLLVWVPRHPQRFDEVAATLHKHGLAVQRRRVAPGILPTPGIDVYLGDTLGEMAFYLGAADVTLMGGSFGDFGSQNFLEPCAAGSMVIVGPSIHNFQEAATDALANGVIDQVDTPEAAWAMAQQQLAAAPAWRAARQARARDWLNQHQGATRRIMNALSRMIERQR